MMTTVTESRRAVTYGSVGGKSRSIDAYECDVVIDQLFTDGVQHQSVMCKHYELHPTAAGR